MKQENDEETKAQASTEPKKDLADEKVAEPKKEEKPKKQDISLVGLSRMRLGNDGVMQVWNDPKNRAALNGAASRLAYTWENAPIMVGRNLELAKKIIASAKTLFGGHE